MQVQEEYADGTVIQLDSLRRLRGARRANAGHTTTVAIAGGRSLMRAGVRMLLEADQQITVVAETSWGDDVKALVRRARPDVVLVDPTGSDFAAAHALESLCELAASGIAVMLLTEPETEAELHAALRAGARGVLSSSAGPAELTRAIRVLARGDAVLSPAATRRLIAAFASASVAPA